MKFIINHIPVSSKNEYGFNRYTKKIFTRPDIKQYYKSAEMQLRSQAKQYDYQFPLIDDIQCSFIFYVPDYRRDFINLLSAPADALQKSEIIKNDRQIKCIDGSKMIKDNDNRTEIFITLLKDNNHNK
jgi:Holliday junction resolvase RusA-like endonuclease